MQGPQLLLPGMTSEKKSVNLAAVLTQAGLASSIPVAQSYIDNGSVAVQFKVKWELLKSGQKMFDIQINQPFYMRAGKRIRKVVVSK